MVSLNLAATGLDPGNFPARPWISGPIMLASGLNYTGYSSETIPADATNPLACTLNVYELLVPVVTGRTKRCFVMCREMNTEMKPILVVGLPATSAYGGDGCKELWRNTPGVVNTEFRWPAQVVRDQNCFAVVIDRANGAQNPTLCYDPLDGETILDAGNSASTPPMPPRPYPGNPYDPLIEDIACIEAARHFINNAPVLKMHSLAKGVRLPLIPHMLVGGLSWGAISSAWLLAACPEIIGGYLAGMYLNANWYNSNPAYQPGFSPTEWQLSGFNYANALANSEAKEIVLSWGASSDDAYVGPPSGRKAEVDAIVASMQAAKPGKYVKNLSASVLHHAVDLTHCRAKFADWFGRLTNTSWTMAIPPFSG